MIICFLMVGCTKKEVIEEVVETPVSTVEPTIQVEEVSLNSSIKPYGLNEEGQKIFNLLTDKDTQLYTLNIKDGIGKHINVSSYRLTYNGWFKEDIMSKEIQQDQNNIGLNVREVKDSIDDDSDTFEINVLDFDDSGNKTKVTKYIEYDELEDEMVMSQQFNSDIEIEENHEYIIYQLVGSYGSIIQSGSYNTFEELDETLRNGELHADAVMIITVSVG